MKQVTVIYFFFITFCQAQQTAYFNGLIDLGGSNPEVYRFITYSESDLAYSIAGSAIGNNKPLYYKCTDNFIPIDTVFVETSSSADVNIPGYSNYFFVDYSNNLILSSTMQYALPDENGYIVKLNSNGDTIWTKEIGSITNYDSFVTSLLAPDSTYLFAGRTATLSGGLSLDGWLLNLDTNGVILWQQNYGGSGDELFSSMDTTSDGGYILCGYTNSYGAGGNDIYLVKTDADGNFMWHQWYGLNLNDSGRIIALPNGHFILCGAYTYINVAFPSQTASHGIAMELDENGNQVWFKEYATYPTGTLDYYNFDEGFNSLLVVSDGYVFSGVSLDNVDGNPLGWIVKTDFSGNQLWSRRYRKRNNDNYFYGSTKTTGDNLAFVGFVFPSEIGETQDGWIVGTNCLGFDQPPSANAQAHFDDNHTIVLENNSQFFGECVIHWGDGNSTTVTEFDDSLVSHQYADNSLYQIEIIANACTDADTFSLNVNPVMLGNTSIEKDSLLFNIFPNPANERVNLTFNEISSGQVQIFDITGKLVYFEKILVTKSQLQIDLTTFESGTYFVQLNSENNVGIRKLVVY